MEALSSLITQAERAGIIIGVPTSKRGPRLTHLFFVDDSLLFCKANPVEWRRIVKIMEKYEMASGKKLNLNKTSIFFSRNTNQAKRQETTTLITLPGFQATNRYDTYLGLPAMVGRSRRQAFQRIKDKVWHRIINWKNKFISQAGKEILLKVVI